MIRYFIVILFLVCLTSCKQNEVFYEFESIPQSKWNKSHDICFAMDSVPENIKPNYHLSIEIAYNLNYPYKNLWLIIDYLLQDSILKQDTLECILMDSADKWLGSGNGPTRQLSVLYKTDFVMDTAQLNQICIRHAMQDIQLDGIEKIGLKVY